MARNNLSGPPPPSVILSVLRLLPRALSLLCQYFPANPHQPHLIIMEDQSLTICTLATGAVLGEATKVRSSRPRVALVPYTALTSATRYNYHTAFVKMPMVDVDQARVGI